MEKVKSGRKESKGGVHIERVTAGSNDVKRYVERRKTVEERSRRKVHDMKRVD